MKVNFENIYEHIGILFYAIASEHGKLNSVTYDKLSTLVNQQWSVSPEVNSLEAHMVDQLRSGMGQAFHDQLRPDVAFDHFRTCFTIHNLPFGKTLRAKILSSANAISAEFSFNGTRSNFVTSLEILLQINTIVAT